MAETYTGKSISEGLDELIDDFRYTMNFTLDLFEELPPYFWWDELKEKVEHIKDINKKYFERE